MTPRPTQPDSPNRDAYLELDDRALLSQSEVDTYRARGPGGQKRNKTDSAVRLRHRPTGLIVIAVESRSQHDNRAKALKRLRQAIALDIRAPIDLGRYEPCLALSEALAQKPPLRISQKNVRYHYAVAEILDLLHACDGQVSAAAKKLEISTGNLVAFILRDPKLLARVNQMRSEHGIKPLR